MDQFQDRAKRLIQYLKHLATIKSKIIKDISDYHKVLWLNEIPKDSEYCFTQAWGINDEFNEDIWIEISKYDEPILDEVPKKYVKIG